MNQKAVAEVPSVTDLPAVAGGQPAKQTPYGTDRRYGEEELHELEAALRQGTLFYTQGQKVYQLEAAFAQQTGAAYAVATSSGTASIHAALIAAGISPGDEVIVSPITDMGSVAPILYQGAVPIFADLHPTTYTLDPADVETRITPKTRAIIAVHLGGNACDLAALQTLAQRHNVYLIEDCAQAFGCTYGGRPIGTIGQIGCFSLNEFKHIACGDGGLVVTHDAQLATRLRLSTDKCYNRQADTPAARNPVFLANNYRMTELQGAVALAQLSKLDDIVQRRRGWVAALQAALTGLPGITLPTETPGCQSSWWFYLLRVQPATLGADADTFAAALRAEGLSASAHYIGQPIYEYPIFTEHSAFERGWHPYQEYTYTKGLCPVAEAILDTCIMLPVKESYTETDLAETVVGIQRVVAWFHRNATTN